MNKRERFICPECGESQPLAHRMTTPGEDRCRLCVYGPEFEDVAHKANAEAVANELAAKQRFLINHPAYKAAWAATFASKTHED